MSIAAVLLWDASEQCLHRYALADLGSLRPVGGACMLVIVVLAAASSSSLHYRPSPRAAAKVPLEGRRWTGLGEEEEVEGRQGEV